MLYPHIDPVLIQLGPFAVRWYGLAYALGYLAIDAWGKWRIRHQPHESLTQTVWSDCFFLSMVGAVIGGRIGYMIIYHTQSWWHQPWIVFYVWQGGMSFHGGLLGAGLATYYATRKQTIPYLVFLDFLAPMIPLGLGFGRMANFINGELWGRPTYHDWGMIFPYVDNQLRHPSQLYECMGEGILLGILLWWFCRKKRPIGQPIGFFLLGYSVIRFSLEFFREPDAQLGLLMGQLSMGQWLCFPMFIFSVWLITPGFIGKVKKVC